MARHLVAGAALLLTACSVADNLSYSEIVVELDGIVTLKVDRTERRIEYAKKAPVSAWYMRQFWLVPFRWGLGAIFGVRHEAELENPGGHVRELLEELPDEAGSDLVACCQTAIRMGWIAELDDSVASRLVGLDGLAGICGRLEIPLFRAPFEDRLIPMEETQLALARAGIQSGRPDARAAQAWDDSRRANYVQSLQAVVARPQAKAVQRLLLLQDLLVVHEAETDRVAKEATAVALRAAIAHCAEGAMLQAVQGRDPLLVDVRLCAMEQVRRTGGPEAVPLLLSVMAATPEQLANNEPRFDPDPMVRLRLVHYCGQLRGQLALSEVRLVGTERWQAVAPADFLAQTILTEQSYYSKLRLPALAALSLTLGRPRLEYDAAWVKAWVDQRERERRS